MDGCFLVILIISTANLDINNTQHKCVGICMSILVCVCTIIELVEQKVHTART